MNMKKLILILLFLVFAVSPSCAGDARRGNAFARQNCAMCHAIGISGESPNPRSPTFWEIAHKYEPRDLEEALSEGIVVSHDMPMPQFELDPNDIEDLITYLESLRRMPSRQGPNPINQPLRRRASTD